MTLNKIRSRIDDLKMAIEIYTIILNRKDSLLINHNSINNFIANHKKEIDKLEETIYLQEYDDSPINIQE